MRRDRWITASGQLWKVLVLVAFELPFVYQLFHGLSVRVPPFGPGLAQALPIALCIVGFVWASASIRCPRCRSPLFYRELTGPLFRKRLLFLKECPYCGFPYETRHDDEGNPVSGDQGRSTEETPRRPVVVPSFGLGTLCGWGASVIGLILAMALRFPKPPLGLARWPLWIYLLIALPVPVLVVSTRPRRAPWFHRAAFAGGYCLVPAALIASEMFGAFGAHP
jgi:uncharacterized protein (DUF983 family)